MLAVCMLFGCRGTDDRTELRVLVADSLLGPFRALSEAFETAHRDVQVVLISGGSVLAARRLIDGSDRADVLAVADQLVIDRLLRPHHAAWSICFATNEVGIAYTHMSKRAAMLDAENWFDILSEANVRVQAANPLHDPCGYWTELCWKLADIHHGNPSADRPTIHERMTRKCGPPADRRTDSQQLLQLLESAGGIDYAFIYRSQALQHHLAFLRLPPQVSLGSARYAETYRRVSIELPKPEGGGNFTKHGAPIVFAITIPMGAGQPQRAESFLRFLLSASGRSILTSQHVEAIERPWSTDRDLLPVSLRERVGAAPADEESIVP